MQQLYKSFYTLVFFFPFLFLHVSLYAQNTVGTVFQDSTLQEGYTLVYPEFQPNTYLIDPCGQIVNTWEGQDDTAPGFSVYLDEQGNLIRAFRPNQDPAGVEITGSGQAGFVEIVDWDNNLIWSHEQIMGNRRLHHDIEVLPNGNILLNAWQGISLDDALALGRDPETLISQNLFDEVIYEINPNTDEIVWEWKASDHLIQTFNTSAPNWVGNPAAWPQRIDLNYVGDSNRRNDWLHFNSLEYDSELDQIIISCPSFGEFWIIDHSTTTAEAAGTTGGRSGKGGDLLYRWGNPESYNAGTADDKKLFFHHAVQLVSEQLSDKTQRRGEIILFNNRQNQFSSVDILTLPEFDSTTWNYVMEGDVYGPLEIDRKIIHPVDPSLLFSTIMSSGQMLDNGNVLINATIPGTITEITPNDEIAWEYVVPFSNGLQLEQGTAVTSGQGESFIFKADKYPNTFVGFEGRDLTPTGYLELNPDTTLCGGMVLDTMMMDTMMMDTMMMDTMDLSAVNLTILNQVDLFPNPTLDFIQLDWLSRATPYEIYSIDGKARLSGQVDRGKNRISVHHLRPGMYIIRFDQIGAKRFIKL